MANHPFPSDALLIRWGDFEAGAYGWLAIAVFLIIVLGLLFAGSIKR